jgi:hypothetical protein
MSTIVLNMLHHIHKETHFSIGHCALNFAPIELYIAAIDAELHDRSIGLVVMTFPLQSRLLECQNPPGLNIIRAAERCNDGKGPGFDPRIDLSFCHRLYDPELLAPVSKARKLSEISHFWTLVEIEKGVDEDFCLFVERPGFWLSFALISLSIAFDFVEQLISFWRSILK